MKDTSRRCCGARRPRSWGWTATAAGAAAAAALLAAPAQAFVASPPATAAATSSGACSAAAPWHRRPAGAPLHAMSIAGLGGMDGDIDDVDTALTSDAVTTTLYPLTNNVAFSALQAVYAVSVAALADAAFSGDWVARGVISPDTAAAAAAAFYNVAGVHVLLAAAAGALATVKGRDPLVAAALTLATGGLGFLREAGSLDAETVRAREAASAPPLFMEINTLTMAQRVSPSGVLLSVSVKAKRGGEYAMRAVLEALAAEVRGGNAEDCYTITVNQDPEDRTNFFLMQRFPSPAAMVRHQNSPAFKAFVAGATPLVGEPMGLYVVNERSGKLEESVYPFGPGGEGGRDDAIYSSPTNIQGSLTGFK